MSRTVVIGAGVVGALSAIELLRHGHKVTIVEPEDPGGEQAASYGNGCWLSSHSVIPTSEPGIWKKVPGYLSDPRGPLSIRPGYLPQAAPWLLRFIKAGGTEARMRRIAASLRSLTAGAPQLHADVAAEAGIADLIDATSGLMHVYSSRQAFEKERLGWEIRRSLGIGWEELEGEALRRIQPDLDRSFSFGVLVPEAGHCRAPGRYVAGLVAHAVARGAELVTSHARDFEIENGRLRAVKTDRDTIACSAAVISAGIHSRPLAARAGDRLPLESERGYHAEIDDPEVAPALPIMANEHKFVAIRTLGGLRAAGQVEIGGLKAPPNWNRTAILLERLQALFPDLPRKLAPERVRTWMGHRPSLPDGLPAIGHASATPDIVHAFGHGHIGLVSSARTSRLVAQLVSRDACEIDIARFSPTRFR
ncbi:FAD-binding oxidoreductase [Afifella sp. IM 167]|uniref:NAD(P)/FAD-dependent oxidoreductase n=1 Tax=Afifella sp. IM 167 TaxID=2033586 RepID=UPI001CCF3A8A|nr:FAD-binding oxidoreductase [Afifella sp. IM 167]MBZ8135155.1 amino acid dehydrogenase [Afifella sp. IM 167]